jgi:hypothetical protein
MKRLLGRCSAKFDSLTDVPLPTLISPFPWRDLRKYVLMSEPIGLTAAFQVASALIGLILAVVGWVLVRESKGLLIDERAGKDLSSSIIALSESQSGIEGANGVVATHLAPDQVVVALSLEFADEWVRPTSKRPCRNWRSAFARSTRRSSPCSSSRKDVKTRRRHCGRSEAIERRRRRPTISIASSLRS